MSEKAHVSKMKEIYNGQVKAALQKEFSFSNVHQIPRISKVVINIGLGDSSQNSKALDAGVEELTKIAGQKPLVTRAKKSVAGFKVRENMPIGAMVTLRQDRMYDFLTKLVCVAMPRIRDFRGLNEKGFDGHGNYNIGLKDQLIFPEIDYDKVSRIRGMNITIVTDTNSDIEAKALLTHLGFPFKKPKQQKAG